MNSRTNFHISWVFGEHWRKLFRVNLLAGPSPLASRSEKLEVAVGEVWAVVGVKYEDAWMWLGNLRRGRHFAPVGYRYGREAELAGAQESLMLGVVEYQIGQQDQIESPPGFSISRQGVDEVVDGLAPYIALRRHPSPLLLVAHILPDIVLEVLDQCRVGIVRQHDLSEYPHDSWQPAARAQFQHELAIDQFSVRI